MKRDLIRTRTAEGRRRGKEERCNQAALAGRDVAGIGAQLQRQPRHISRLGAHDLYIDITSSRRYVNPVQNTDSHGG
jgi:hypothetical protein